MSLQLPAPIRNYFEADKIGYDAVGACFENNAIVKDERNIHIGIEAIMNWKKDADSKNTYEVRPFSIEFSGEKTIVNSTLSGNFKGSPINLKYIFKHNGNKILELEIRP